MEQPLIPVFKGESYELWSIPRKTILKFQDLWDLVERGFLMKKIGNENPRKKTLRRRCLSSMLSMTTFFSRNATATTSKQAWSILQKEFQGDLKVIVVRL